MTTAAYIRTGALNKRADLQSRTQTADGGGGVSVVWATERNIWIAIRERSAQERVQSMKEQAQISHEIWARWADDITPDKRIQFGGVAYNIRAVMNPEAGNEFVRILADSGVAT